MRKGRPKLSLQILILEWRTGYAERLVAIFHTFRLIVKK